MSTITKVAVYDARLMQDEPAYAVQKGALSVSVAPFMAISATASQMTFQVLVPSLNVFIDRKIQLKTSLNFSANLFYSGPRGVTTQLFNTNNALTITTDPAVSAITFSEAPTCGLVVGTRITYNANVPEGGSDTWVSFTCVVTRVTSTTICYADRVIPRVDGGPCPVIETPVNWDAPTPSMGIRGDLTTNSFTYGLNSTEAFLPLGYATAVSAKDLSFCQFPIQSSLTNMTATLNDCTVTTNGDTLREQLMLTNNIENNRQRTTPQSADTFSWGRDDANNSSGNFSSYSVTDAYGDIPNGAFPTTWYADSGNAVPLAQVSKVLAANVSGSGTPGATSATYPFLPIGSSGSFNLGISGSSIKTGAGGCGWYIAKVNATNVAGAYTGGVVVPFVDGQPVWTTAFPGGDMYSLENTTVGAGAMPGAGTPGFSIRTVNGSEVLLLLKSVPPYSMIGARIITTTSAAAGAVSIAFGFVSGLLSGSLGQVGSTYSYVSSVSLITAVNLSLSAGIPVTYPLPVFGAVSVVEPLVISPLIWSDSAEFKSVGLYGMTNMQFTMNFVGSLGNTRAILVGPTLNSAALAADAYWTDDLTTINSSTGNVLRSSSIRTTLSDLSFLNTSSNQFGPWTTPTLYAEFLTPGPDVTLPLVSTVPYVEFPRYTVNQTVSAGGSIGTTTFSTNTLSLTSIPDMIMLYVKPGTRGPSQLDQYIPIRNVSISFDNFSNLCSGFQQFNLYESTVASGLEMDWHQWRGYTQGATNSAARVTPVSTFASTNNLTYNMTGATQLSGGPLILRMGHDVTLSPGLAPGCLGNYSIQCNMTLDNSYGFYDYLQSVTITLIAINTGFFETVRGQSAIRKTVLNSADVEAAVPETGMTKTHLARMIGRGSSAVTSFSTYPSRALAQSSLTHKLHGSAGGGGTRFGADGGGQKRHRSGI